MPGGACCRWGAGLAARPAVGLAAAGLILGGQSRRGARLALRGRRARGCRCASNRWQGSGLRSPGQGLPRPPGIPAWLVGDVQAQEGPCGSVETFSLKSRCLSYPENGFSRQGSKQLQKGWRSFQHRLLPTHHHPPTPPEIPWVCWSSPAPLARWDMHRADADAARWRQAGRAGRAGRVGRAGRAGREGEQAGQAGREGRQGGQGEQAGRAGRESRQSEQAGRESRQAGRQSRQGCPLRERCCAPPLPAPLCLPQERPCFNC